MVPKKKKTSKKRNLTKAEQIARIPIEQLVTLKGEEGKKQLISYVRTLRTGYTRRVQAFKRRGIFSYAQYALEETAPMNLPKQLTKLTRNQLIGELARYQKFFNDKTSSIEGIKEINLAQDIRIFGEDEKGRPLGSMTDEQRSKFWSMYDEYKNQYKTGIFRYSSESVQQFLASAMFDDGISTDSISDLLNEVEARLASNQLEEDLGSVPNVYSGKGPYRA